MLPNFRHGIQVDFIENAVARYQVLTTKLTTPHPNPRPGFATESASSLPPPKKTQIKTRHFASIKTTKVQVIIKK